MSVEAMSAALRLPAHVASPARFVLVAIANHADAEGYAYPGHKAIAEATGFTVGHVRRIVGQLSADGEHPKLLARSVNAAPDDRIRGDRKPNLYELRFLDECSCGEALRPVSRARAEAHPLQNCAPVDDETGARGSTDGRAPTRAKPSVEPSVEKNTLLHVPSSREVKSKSASDAYERDFDEWWAGYPRKIEKGKARAKYQARRRAGVTAETLTKALARYVEQLRADGTEGRFVQYAATFLGPEGRWADLSAPPAQDGGTDPAGPETATQAPLSANEPLREPTVDEQADEMLGRWREWRKRRFALESGEMWDEAAAAAREAFRSALEAGHSREVVSRAMIALVEAHAVEWGTTGVTRLGPDAEALAGQLAHAPREAVG